MIKSAKDLNFDNKKLFVIIAGVPGIGKTTLALSSPKPLLIDLDKGISRVETRYRTDTEEVSTFSELVSDLKNSDLSNYETLVIDTGGKLFDLMRPEVIAENKSNVKSNGELSLQGYGVIKRKYIEFVKMVKSLNKHLVMVFHASEEKLPNDITGLRIRLEGGARNDIWDDVDVGGFVEMKGKDRIIGFSNCERYYAKGTHGIHGEWTIPTLEKGNNNTFLTELFEKIQNDLNNESKELGEYQAIMDKFVPMIEDTNNVDELNAVFEQIKVAPKHLTSAEELWVKLMDQATSLELTYDKSTKTFRK